MLLHRFVTKERDKRLKFFHVVSHQAMPLLPQVVLLVLFVTFIMQESTRVALLSWRKGLMGYCCIFCISRCQNSILSFSHSLFFFYALLHTSLSIVFLPCFSIYTHSATLSTVQNTLEISICLKCANIFTGYCRKEHNTIRNLKVCNCFNGLQA